MQSSRVAAFADDTSFSKTIVTRWPKESRLLIVLWWPSLFGINIARTESQTEYPFLYNTFRLPANANVARCYLEVGNEYPDIHFKPSTDLSRVFRNVLSYVYANNDFQGETLLNISNFKSLFPFLLTQKNKKWISKMELQDYCFIRNWQPIQTLIITLTHWCFTKEKLK